MYKAFIRIQYKLETALMAQSV